MAQRPPNNLTPAPLPSERQKKMEELKKQYHVLRERDKQKVKGKFIFHEVPGGSFGFSFGPMYKGDETETYHFMDGEVYEIPLGVARHLNKNGWYPEYGFIPGETVHNIPGTTMRIAKKNRRFSFQSLEFVDIDELPTNNIVAVENVIL